MSTQGIGILNSITGIPIYGCTNSLYIEYDPNATIDDGSCNNIAQQGCTDDNYVEYNPTANIDDGSCATPIVNGCTDSTAFNFDPAANTDDGSCIAVVNGCSDSTAMNYNTSVNVDDGSCYYDILGCSDSSNCGNVENIATPAFLPMIMQDNSGFFAVDYLYNNLGYDWMQNSSVSTPTKFETQLVVAAGDQVPGNFGAAATYIKNYQNQIPHSQAISHYYPIMSPIVTGDWIHYRIRWKYIDQFNNEYYGPWNDFWKQVQ